MADQRPRTYRPRKPAVSPEQAAIEGLLKGIWQILVGIFSLFRGLSGGQKTSGRSARLAELREHWEQVELHALQPATFPQAVAEADKILDAALQAKGVGGTTMGERLKGSRKLFDAALYERIWDAHKLRNVMAHEVGSSLSAKQTQEAVAAFRSALYQLNVLH